MAISDINSEDRLVQRTFAEHLRDRLQWEADRERLKQASKMLLASLRALLRPMADWTQKAATQAEVKVFILDRLYEALPRPPFTEPETEEIASRVYDYVWQRSASGDDLLAA